MKQILISIFVILSIYSKAQFGIGPKAGVEFSSDMILSDNRTIVLHRQPYIGSTYSLSLMLGHGDVFHFQPEFFYSQIGSKYYFEDQNTTYTQQRNYVGVNTLFDIGFTKDNFRFFGQPGIYVAILSSGLMETDSSGTITYNTLHSANSMYGDTGIPLDIGFSFGLGLQYKLGNGWLSFNPKYRFGFMPHSYNSIDVDRMFFNKSYTLSLSYIFIIGH
jgi:hypothetical protein